METANAFNKEVDMEETNQRHRDKETMNKLKLNNTVRITEGQSL